MFQSYLISLHCWVTSRHKCSWHSEWKLTSWVPLLLCGSLQLLFSAEGDIDITSVGSESRFLHSNFRPKAILVFLFKKAPWLQNSVNTAFIFFSPGIKKNPGVSVLEGSWRHSSLNAGINYSFLRLSSNVSWCRPEVTLCDWQDVSFWGGSSAQSAPNVGPSSCSFAGIFCL